MSRPTILAVDDELARLQSAAEGDPANAIADARSRLEAFEARSAASQASLLDEADELLVRAEERLEGDRARDVAAVRNRIRIYRDTVSRTDEDLAVIDTTIRTESGDEETIAALHGRTVEIVATVVNAGTARDVVLGVGFYDDGGEQLEEVATDPIPFDEDEQAAVDLEVDVPDGTRYYAASALDADTQTVG